MLGTDLPFDMAEPDAMSLVSETLGEADAAVIAERNPLRLFDLMTVARLNEGKR